MQGICGLAEAQMALAEAYGIDCLMQCSDPARELIDIAGGDDGSRHSGIAHEHEGEVELVAEAIHANCISCHKDYNKKNKTKAAPQSCTKCHPKKKK